MTDRPAPFIGATRVPWLRPLAQVLRVVALVVGAVTASALGWTLLDVIVAVVLVGFLAWRSLPPDVASTRLRDVLGAEVVLSSVAVLSTGGWASPWLLAQFVPLGLAALGITTTRAALLAATAVVGDTVAALPAMPALEDVVARATTLAALVGFAALTRTLLASIGGEQDEALGRLEVLWSVRSMLQGLHAEVVSSPVAFSLDEAVATVRASSRHLGAADVVGVFQLGPDGVLRRLHGIGLPDRTYRVRDLPGRAGAPARDGVPIGIELPFGGVSERARWGAYVWLPVAEHEPEHVLVVEHAGRDLALDDVLPDLGRLARPLAVTTSNAAWFTRVSRLGVDEERQRIAARLHDEFAQSLTAVSMQLESATRRHPDDDQLRALRGHVRQTLSELRDTMVELRAVVDAGHPLADVLGGLVDRFGDRHGVVAEFTADEQGDRVPDSVAQQLLRITQELLQRSVEDRHAFAVYVSLCSDDTTIALQVRDDGEPPPLERHRPVAEVTRDRAEAIGATVDTDNDVGGLSTVTITLQRPTSERGRP